MAYFNHAYTKMFLGTGTTRNAGVAGPTNPHSTGGFIITPNVPSAELSKLATGYFGFFDPNTYLSVDPTLGSYDCCPLILASSAVLQNDKIGPFHGGYRETNKSKMINPKYVQKAYWVKPCFPKQAIVSIGNTPQTGDGIATLDAGSLVAGTGYTNGTSITTVTGGTGTGARVQITVAGNVVTAVTLIEAGIGYTVGDTLTIVGGNNDATIDVLTIAPALAAEDFQGGTTSSTCCFTFLCGETYYLRIDVKGSPALRALNHNAYQTVDAYTGCCTGPTPTPVDSTLVFIDWAKNIVRNNYLNPFVMPVVFDQTGVAWYAPGTTVDLITGAAVTSAQWWDAYVSPGYINGACGGMRLLGAFVETKFGNCTFQVTDFFEKEPIKIYASMVDYTGDPCVFEGICVHNDCLGLQGMGFGEQVVRDLIKAESYLQNFFASNDFRIREITQGYDMTNAVNRNALYSRYFILHSVPRFNNPTGVFDNDRYMNEIIVAEPGFTGPTSTAVGNTALNTFLNNWLGTCANCVPFEEFDCVQCTPIVN